jgi:hypothetical protein
LAVHAEVEEGEESVFEVRSQGFGHFEGDLTDVISQALE